MELSGEKILLSKISINDLDFICRIECNKNLWYFEEYVESDKNVVREEYIQKIEEKEKPTSYDFIVTIATDKSKTPIGLAQIWNNSEYRKSWEIGFAILPEYWGKGYGSEAARLLLQFAFEELDAHKVVGMCNANNTRSAALMEHIGMRREAIFKEELFWQNKWVDQYYFSILEREYFDRN
ncbi:GNAT family N-acetyltransferase [Thermoflavimicrobium daqui]|jgi:RimJ/RimL family protein N-acetyltransferase|uniref:GNAT family N-acetyltransferase n=1 Tax=Thermoflavimicrobium daqui TaxID=2137476 RepID=A0A364K4D0_9BACL|nr:GNAT family protein [Thermoflavimicrobium daqui]RAL24225.1 GNAT family N-acetyltransferase [Thermoflavimicrobium daqui]